MVLIWFVFMVFIYNQRGPFFCLHHLIVFIYQNTSYIYALDYVCLKTCAIFKDGRNSQKLLWWFLARGAIFAADFKDSAPVFFTLQLWNQFSLLYVWILEHFHCGTIFQKHLFFITS